LPIGRFLIVLFIIVSLLTVCLAIKRIYAITVLIYYKIYLTITIYCLKVQFDNQKWFERFIRYSLLLF